MKTLGKYRFGSKAAATRKINELGEEHRHLIVNLKHPIGAVQSNDWLVDVLWDGEPNEDWESAFVYTASPQHMLGGTGVQGQYMAKVKAKHPELFPEPEVEAEEEDVE